MNNQQTLQQRQPPLQTKLFFCEGYEYVFRTFHGNEYIVGTIDDVDQGWLILRGVCWIEDCGRFGDIASGRRKCELVTSRGVPLYLAVAEIAESCRTTNLKVVAQV